MKKNILLTFFYFIVAASSFSSSGASFEKRWFWFYSDTNEKGHVVITYDHKDEKLCSITINEEEVLPYIPNPFDSLTDESIGHWPNLFGLSDKVRKGEVDIGYSFTIPGNDPLLQHIIEQPTVFTVKISTKFSRSEKYHKVVFKSADGATVVVYLEKINESEYRVSALFLRSKKGKRYSYRDYSFKRDFPDGDSGAGTLVNFLHHQSDTHHQEYSESKLIDNLVVPSERITIPLELVSQIFVYTYILKFSDCMHAT